MLGNGNGWSANGQKSLQQDRTSNIDSERVILCTSAQSLGNLWKAFYFTKPWVPANTNKSTYLYELAHKHRSSTPCLIVPIGPELKSGIHLRLRGRLSSPECVPQTVPCCAFFASFAAPNPRKWWICPWNMPRVASVTCMAARCGGCCWRTGARHCSERTGVVGGILTCR